MTVSRTIGPAGGGYDYSSIQTWEAGEQQDLVANGHDYSEAVCYSMVDGSGGGDWIVDGWTTDATHRIVIRAAAGHEHNGLRGVGYRINSNQFFVSEDFVDMRDVCVQAKLNTAMAAASGFLFERLLTLKGFYWGGGTGTCRDSICIGTATDDALSVENNWSTPTATIENVTAIGGPYGIRRLTATAMHVRNCYARGTTAAYGGSFNTFSKCASADATGSEAALRNIAYSTANFVNVTAGSEDLHLPAGSALIDVGADLGAGRYDIDRDARSAPFDIGADERVAAGLSISPSAIAAVEAVGTPLLAYELVTTTIDFATELGVPALTYEIQSVGIVGEEGALGVAVLSYELAPAGIEVVESLGAPALEHVLEVTGIPLTEIVGTPALDYAIAPIGIVAPDALGIPIVGDGINVFVVAIAAPSAFGVPTIGLQFRGTRFTDIRIKPHASDARVAPHMTDARIKDYAA